LGGQLNRLIIWCCWCWRRWRWRWTDAIRWALDGGAAEREGEFVVLPGPSSTWHESTTFVQRRRQGQPRADRGRRRVHHRFQFHAILERPALSYAITVTDARRDRSWSDRHGICHVTNLNRTFALLGLFMNRVNRLALFIFDRIITRIDDYKKNDIL
jgi:hypothetical protein